jgi:hypothetical protein
MPCFIRTDALDPACLFERGKIALDGFSGNRKSGSRFFGCQIRMAKQHF